MVVGLSLFMIILCLGALRLRWVFLVLRGANNQQVGGSNPLGLPRRSP